MCVHLTLRIMHRQVAENVLSARSTNSKNVLNLLRLSYLSKSIEYRAGGGHRASEHLANFWQLDGA